MWGGLRHGSFAFKVSLVAVVRVRAEDKSAARKVVPTVLGAPGVVEIRLANENNADVDFSIGSVKPQLVRKGKMRRVGY
jgi:hypothetical protein